VLKRVNALLNDIARAGAIGKPNIGIGKPEASSTDSTATGHDASPTSTD
jgi:hypothetical protein